MDTLQHGALTGLAAHQLGATIEQSLIIGGVSTLPDVIGFAENVYQGDWDAWNWYRSAHSEIGSLFIGFVAFCVMYSFAIPFYVCCGAFAVVIHPLIDKFWHDPVTGKWKKNSWKWSVVIWIVLIAWFIFQIYV